MRQWWPHATKGNVAISIMKGLFEKKPMNKRKLNYRMSAGRVQKEVMQMLGIAAHPSSDTPPRLAMSQTDHDRPRRPMAS